MHSRSIAFAIVLWLAAAGMSTAAPRIWLFTPVLPPGTNPEFAARPIAVTTKLARALRADPRVTLADSIEQADVIVEVGAAPRRTYTDRGDKTVEIITLAISAGRTRTVLQARAQRSKDAESDALQQLLGWLHDHARDLDIVPRD
jgi:xanthine/CO dehydrogenase XdhC/CoxF family maturation factor